MIGAEQAPSPLAALKHLRAAKESHLERRSESHALADKILASRAPIVIVHGGDQVEKEEFLQEWLAPELTARTNGVAREPQQEPTATGARSLEIWGDAEARLFDAEDQASALSKLASLATGQQQRAVLLLPEQRLGDLFELSAQVPGLLDETIAIPAIRTEQFIEALTRLLTTLKRSLAAEARAAIGTELEREHAKYPLDSKLLVLLAFELQRSFPAAEIDARSYQEAGGLRGLLLHFLDFCCEQLPHSTGPNAGWALLEHLCADGSSAELDGVAARLDLTHGAVQQYLAWFVEQGLLVPSTGGSYQLAPALLREIVHERRERLADQNQEALWILRQGVRSFLQFDALLSEVSFLRVHAVRAELCVGDDEAKLLLRCALAYESERAPGAIAHWLRRLPCADARAEILLEASSDPRYEVRAAALRHLGELGDAAFFSHLRLLALGDDAAEVRAAAAVGLARLGEPELATLEATLLAEIESTDSPHRGRAIELLRICKTDNVVCRLEKLIASNQPGQDGVARKLAIEALAQQDHRAAADALFRVAVRDPDEEDRLHAAVALAGTRNEAVASRLLQHLSGQRGKALAPPIQARSTYSTVLGFFGAGATASLLPVPALALWTIGHARLAAFLLLAQLIALGLLATDATEWALALGAGSALIGSLATLRSLLLERMGDDVVRSPYRMWLGRMLFAHFVCFAWAPGLASILVNRIDRGLALALTALAGVTMVAIPTSLSQTFSAYASVSRAFVVLPQIFLWLGLALLVGARCWDVLPVFRTAFTRTGRRQRLEKRADLLTTQLLRNATFLDLVSRAFGHADAALAGPALTLLRRPYVRVPWAALCDRVIALGASNELGQRRLRALAHKRADADALAFLARHKGVLSKVRYRVSAARFALTLIPASIVMLVGLAFPLMASLVYLGVRYWQHQPTTLGAAALKSEPEAQGKAKHATETLASLAASDDPMLAKQATEQLKAVAESDAPQKSLAFTLLAQTIGEASAKLEEQSAEVTLALLDGREGRDTELVALKKMPTWRALEKLTQFVDARAKQPAGTLTEADLSKLTLIIEVIEDAPLSSAERLRILSRWVEVPAFTRLTPVIGTALDKVLIGAGAADRSEYYAKRGAKRSATGSRELAESDLVLALGALDELNVAEVPVDTASELFTLTLHLSREWHDSVALGKQDAYEKSYNALKRLLRLRSALPDDRVLTLLSELAESSLTTDHPAEAREFAREWMARGTKASDPSGLVALVMHFLVFSADVLEGKRDDAKRSEQTLEALLSGSQRTDVWRFDGTQRYLACKADLSRADRAWLMKRLRQVEYKASYEQTANRPCLQQ